MNTLIKTRLQQRILNGIGSLANAQSTSQISTSQTVKGADNTPQQVTSSNEKLSHISYLNEAGETHYAIVKNSELEQNIAGKRFFAGFASGQVHFYSCLRLAFPADRAGELPVLLKRYRYSCFAQNNDQWLTLLLPLATDIYNADKYDELLNALFYVLQLAHNHKPQWQNATFIALGEITTSQQGELIDPQSFIQFAQRKRNQLKAQKNKHRLNAIKTSLYTVKRFNHDKQKTPDTTSIFSIVGLLKAPFTLKDVAHYSTETGVGATMASGLGIDKKIIESITKTGTSKPFKCLLNPDHQAELYICKNDSFYNGKITYKIKTTGEHLALHEVYGRLIFGNDLKPPTLMTLLLKLLDDCGLIIRKNTQQSLTEPLTVSEKTTLNGFIQLNDLKQCIKSQSADNAIIFTSTFAAKWCQLSRITVTKCIKNLVEKNLLALTEKISDFATYVLTAGDITKQQETDNDIKQTNLINQLLHSRYANKPVKQILPLADAIKARFNYANNLVNIREDSATDRVPDTVKMVT
jgi:hypothetical protein